jgi:uncharacterized protein (TIGR02646 family)
MRKVDKKQEPLCLQAHRAQQDAVYENLPSGCPEAIRQALVLEQGSLCAFCMCRIKPVAGSMKIAHRYPREAPNGREGKRDLQWKNLLGACMGGEGKPANLHTCDTKQGSTIIALDPTEEPHMAQITYSTTGKVQSRNLDHQKEIDDVLNLNCKPLINARASTLEGLLQAWEMRKPGAWTKPYVERTLQSLGAGTELLPFVGIAEDYLRRRLARM